MATQAATAPPRRGDAAYVSMRHLGPKVPLTARAGLRNEPRVSVACASASSLANSLEGLWAWAIQHTVLQMRAFVVWQV